MKSQVSPVAAVVAVLVVIGVVALALMKFTGGGAGSKEGEKPPGVPPDAAAKLSEVMGKQGPGGQTAPASTAPGGGAPMPGGGGGMTAPNSGQ